MKLLYGTENEAKLQTMRRRLVHMDIELIGPKDLGREIPEIAETGATPLENAHIKAVIYYKAFQIPVFSCDSGLYFPELPEEVQPGVHVRTINGKVLSDQEMREYYCGLARQYGDITAQYRHAFCLVLDENHIYEIMDDSTASEPFLLTSKPSGPIREKGFPLDSISIDISTKKYYYDLNNEKIDAMAVEDGFPAFLEKVLKEQVTSDTKGVI